MALIPKQTPAFENPEAGVTFAGPEPVETVAAPAAVAVRPAQAVAVHKAPVNPFAEIKNAYTVDYNTLSAVLATNGNFMTKEDNTVLGDTIVLQLMSYQDNYVVSPGADGEDAKKLVKYSDDGINLKDGTAVSTYLEDIKAAGYNKAYLSKRVILVGALLDAGKAPHLAETLVQLDLAPTSKALFDRFSIQSAFDTGRGKVTVEQASKIKLTAKVTKNSANQIYTQVQFNYAT